MRNLILSILILTSTLAYGQADTTIIKNNEKIIRKHLKALLIPKTDILQNNINDTIISSFKRIFNLPISFEYPFDSIKHIGKITSSDNQLRFYTWNIPYEDGSHKISGIIQYKVKKDSFTYIVLNDYSEEIEHAENTVLTPNKWYGAMYYDVIVEKIDKKSYYFLMGYNPGTFFSNKKILDVFYFDEYGYPFFGKALFKTTKGLKSRMILEYNEKATITLHYNEKMKMILFHHLVPIDMKYKDNPMFYGPDFTFDGFKFEDDLWHFVENVDVRNNY